MPQGTKGGGVTASGNFGDGDAFHWSLDEYGTLSITGSGNMQNWGSFIGTPWHDYGEDIIKVVVEDGVTSIGNDAFSGCSSLAMISLPAGLISIGDRAFYGCSSLALSSLPDSVELIGTHAFSGCSSLALTSLPAGLISIRNDTFFGCSSLALTSLPAGLTLIEDGAFFDCSSLALTSLPAGLTSIGTGAFSGCSSLALTYLPDSVKFIQDRAFSGCSSLALTSLPAGLSLIEEGTFSDCSSLALTFLPDSMEWIGADAFSGCSSLALTSLPDGVTSIGNNAFAGCTGLTELTFTSINAPTLGSGAFDGCSNLTMYRPNNATGYDGTGWPIDNRIQSYEPYSIMVLSAGNSGMAYAPYSIAREGMKVPLAAVPDSGSHFKEWQVISGGVTLDDAHSAKTTFSMPAEDVTIQAVFEADIYTMTVESSGGGSFEGRHIGYADAPKEQTFTITNTGNQRITDLSVSLSGSNAGGFTLSADGMAASLDPNAATNFTVRPVTGLAEGTYSAVVKITGEPYITETVNLSFTVSSSHVWDAAWTHNGTCHWKKCTVGSCSEKNEEALHNFNSGNTCTVCNCIKTNAETPTVTDPVNASYTVGDTAKPLSVTANVSDGGILTYQWYSNTTNNNTAGSVIIGAVSNTYTPTITAEGTAYYYCVVTNTNHSVAGQKTAMAASGTARIEVASAVTLPWPARYTVSVHNDGNGIASASPGSATAGTTITLTATAKTGYHFKEWQVISGAVSIKDGRFIMPARNVAVKAVFEKDGGTAPPQPARYTVSVQNDGNGKAAASADSATAGTTVTLTATANRGYHFKEWQVVSGGVSIIDGSFTMPEQNVAVKAVFEKDGGAAPPSRNAKIKDKKGTVYTVTKPGLKNGEVAYTAPLNKKITSAAIPATVRIGGITYHVTSIRAKAFQGCRKLKKVTIGKNIRVIGKMAFYGCTQLRSITVQTTKLADKNVGSKAFARLHEKLKVKVPKKKLKAYRKLLKNKGVDGKKQVITK